MQTHFSLAQLADPRIAEADKILRNCVHCGFCTATCPTFNLLGDELDSPRGRIYLIKDMLENDRPADEKVTKHIDRCLACLSCMTTCPSGVHYMHLVDHARVHIEETYRRPIGDRFVRAMLAAVVPNPARFKSALKLAALGRPFIPILRWLGGPFKALAVMLLLAPRQLPDQKGNTSPMKPVSTVGAGRRVVIMQGCAQTVLQPQTNAATERLLLRLGFEIVSITGEGCCGALTHHMGKEEAAMASARANIDAWTHAADHGGLDAIVITASGCGTMVKDYGYMFRNDPHYQKNADRISSLCKDITELLDDIVLPEISDKSELKVAYHSACSMQHGQKITRQPKQLLKQVGFAVCEIPEGHLCCGSAGTYNILQSDLSEQLLDRKMANIEKVAPDIIATGNVGCIAQIGRKAKVPVVHTVELLDWAYGGPVPVAMANMAE